MKIKILSALALVLAIFSANAAGIEDMQGLNLKHIKIPFYKKDTLERIVFAQDGERDGRLVDCNNTFIDTLLEKIDVDKIPDGWQTKIYPLGSKLPFILNFWKNRHNISEYVIFTQKCFIDQNNAVAFGDKKIFFRHPQFDLDGIGFKADFKNKVIEVNSDVRIIVRDTGTDPRKILTGSPVPKQQKNAIATGDSLRIDMKNNEIMLIGNVKVIDGRNTMTCDRLTAYLADKNDDKKEAPAKKADVPEDEKAILDGVSRILADGNVLLVQNPEDPAKEKNGVQTSRSEHLEYDVKRELIILTGDSGEEKPTLTRGSDTQLTGQRIELLRHADRMFVMRDCRIKSVVRDEKGLIERTRTIFSDRANFDGKENIANFHGNVIAVDQTSSLYTDSLRVHLKEDEKGSGHKVDLIFANGSVKIVSRSEKNAPETPGKKIVSVSTVTSKQAELNYRSNKIVFYNDVKIRDGKACLDSDRLDIFLADRKVDEKTAENTPSGAPLAAGMEGKNKTVTKIIATGKVLMLKDKDELKTDILTLFFRDLPPGVKPTPGMIQSGGAQLVKILCDGSVTATSFNKKEGKLLARTLKAANAMSDLLSDYSEFHGNVSIHDSGTEIFCKDMYVFTGAAPVPETAVDENGNKKPVEKTISEEDALDADPFEMDMGENSAPSRIAISDSQDLKRIVCKREVVLLRKDNKGNLQRAGGDQAVYTVDTKEVVLTAERPRRPWIRSNGRKQFSDIIRSDVGSEDLRAIGNIEVMPDVE
ncbi:MAG: hypothetical protein E7051_03660 [Lentisphaerae bacterium]|nr:hypothetical protein [Lentisphaerota bacterium]